MILWFTINDETAYLDEVERLTSWCQDNCLSLNVSKTKELIVDFRKRQQRPYTPLMISGTPVERVNSFKYLGVNISEDLTWTAHIQTRVKKARQRLYHLLQLKKFRISPAILKTFSENRLFLINKWFMHYHVNKSNINLFMLVYESTMYYCSRQMCNSCLTVEKRLKIIIIWVCVIIW